MIFCHINLFTDLYNKVLKNIPVKLSELIRSFIMLRKLLRRLKLIKFEKALI